MGSVFGAKPASAVTNTHSTRYGKMARFAVSAGQDGTTILSSSSGSVRQQDAAVCIQDELGFGPMFALDRVVTTTS